MTKQKHLKARIRARMSKTGESYATARRQVVMDDPEPQAQINGYRLRGGVHPDTAAFANSLANHGVISAHSGMPLSEAMVLGVGGGLGAGYILWQFKGHDPIVTLGFRNQWQYPDAWLEKTAERLQIATRLEHTSGHVKAARSLHDALHSDGPRPLVWMDAQEIGYWHLPEHQSGHGGYPIIVYGEDEGRFLIDDRNSAPLTVDDETLSAARGRVSSYRNRLVQFDPPDVIVADRLKKAVRAGLIDQVQHLSAPSDSFSLAAWRKWSRMLVDTRSKKGWPSAFGEQGGLFSVLLTMYETIESVGYDGGSLRSLYAVFLDEASELMDMRALGPVASGYREVDAQWSQLAEMAAPRSHELFARARDLIDSLHEHVLEDGDAGRKSAVSAAQHLWKLRSRGKSVFSRDEFMELLEQLSAQAEAIYRREKELISQLKAVVGES
jgi:Butirosin biosynthesis protein H, N-terminal/Domain of unknown function (DUF4872)